MKRLFSKAYTLMEVVIVLAIIGMVSVIIIHSVKVGQNSTYKKLYYKAYDALMQASGNAYLEWKEDACNCNYKGINDFLKVTTYCWTRSCWKSYTTDYTVVSDDKFTDDERKNKYEYTNTIEQTMFGAVDGYPRQYPSFLFGQEVDLGNFDGAGTDEEFCKLLTKNINTLDKENECKSFISGIRPEAEGPGNENTEISLSFGSNFLRTFCALDIEKDENGNYRKNPDGTYVGECAGIENSDESIIPSFVAANGQKYYISIVLWASAPNVGGQPSTERRAYRLVVVDLNGDNGPNTQLKKENMLPDLVLFAIKSDGTVVPLGLPEFEQTYANAVVYYPKFLNEVDPDNPNRLKPNRLENSAPMTIYDAKSHAWAGEVTGVATNYFGHRLVAEEPFSFSNMLYFLGVNCAPGGCQKTATNIGEPMYVDKLLANIVMQFIYKGEEQREHFIPTSAEMLLDKDFGCTFGESKCRVEITKD